jgi:dipeptidase D
MTLNGLSPYPVWRNFSLLNAIPRASKKEEKAAEFVLAFAKKAGLAAIRDSAGNVIVKKPGQGNGLSKDPVILQAHLDMVHQKNSDTSFDFDTQGIEMYPDGEWVKAKGTTLGADNGIGVACILSLLEDTKCDHPPLEALFTLDEEAGMSGAKNLDPDVLSGKMLLNLDTEEENEITIGCAGGIDTNVFLEIAYEKTPRKHQAYLLSVKGLKGGHSGMDIHLGRANANKVLFRLLCGAQGQFGMRLSEGEGGGLRNAIPREAFVKLVIPDDNASLFERHIESIAAVISAEYSASDENINITLTPSEIPEKVLLPDVQEKIISAVFSVPNGVYKMSAGIPGLVETSSNLAKVLIRNGKFESQSLQRSSLEAGKHEIASLVGKTFTDIGADVKHSGDYPGWQPDPESPLLRKATVLFREKYGKEPKVLACHAGLECGIIAGKYPELDMISIGPTIRNPHSPDEKVHIPSVGRFWEYLLYLLKAL